MNNIRKAAAVPLKEMLEAVKKIHRVSLTLSREVDEGRLRPRDAFAMLNMTLGTNVKEIADAIDKLIDIIQKGDDDE